MQKKVTFHVNDGSSQKHPTYTTVGWTITIVLPSWINIVQSKLERRIRMLFLLNFVDREYVSQITQTDVSLRYLYFAAFWFVAK